MPLIFYGVNGEHTREGESHSYSNKLEAIMCARLIRNLVDNTEVVANDIGVLALYRYVSTSYTTNCRIFLSSSENTHLEELFM